MNINDLGGQMTDCATSMSQLSGIFSKFSNSSSFSDAFNSIGKISSFEELEDQFGSDLTNDELLSLATISGIDAQCIQNLQNLTLQNTVFDFSSQLGEKTDKQKNSAYLFSADFSSVTENDINLFKKLSSKSDLSLDLINPKTQSFDLNIANSDDTQVSYKSLDVSKTLFSVIETAYNTNKPVRLDFGNDASVILKIDKNGKLSADFIPADKAMEIILRNSLPSLQARFDQEKLPYNQLSYKNFNDNNKQQQKDKEAEKDE